MLYALGGASGGADAVHGQGPARLRVQHDDHRALSSARIDGTIAPGKHRIEVDTTIASRARRPRSCSPSTARRSRARTVKRTVPAAFTASETFDVGVDLGSPVSLDYFDRRPFRFDGKIERSTSS